MFNEPELLKATVVTRSEHIVCFRDSPILHAILRIYMLPAYCPSIGEANRLTYLCFKHHVIVLYAGCMSNKVEEQASERIAKYYYGHTYIYILIVFWVLESNGIHPQILFNKSLCLVGMRRKMLVD